MLDDVIRSNIAKVVAFVLTPILMPLAAAGANWAQDVLGLNLDGAQLAAYLTAIVVGVALTAYAWLRGRAEWETAVVAVQKIHDVGAAQSPTVTWTSTGTTQNP